MAYQYRGTVRDADPEAETAEQPKRKPGRPRSKTPSPCGTPSAYTRHRQRNEPIDDACRQANINACKAWREAKKATP